eukprot:TRINITY_DN5755_c0_g1_i1.p1 TRINITY_DN5755_c0_g1~~TRINITY_DN5755_c0_g1_i1.p1  ORF type:complete len:188 (-),score=45.48 TRINITY_DN5755_c0_g1_i1:280-843(-)
MADDGNCLFSSLADQIYGDSSLHNVIRQRCLDFMETERFHYSQFVQDDFDTYISKQRRLGEYGSNLEIQAVSELYAKKIEVYSYETGVEPINTFQNYPGEPLRISYHNNNHYNSVIDPKSNRQFLAIPNEALEYYSQNNNNNNDNHNNNNSHDDKNLICVGCDLVLADYELLQLHMITECPKAYLFQ